MTIKRIICLVCALVLALSCAYADGDTSRVVLMTVGGVPVYEDDVESMAYQLYYYGYTDSYTDYATALEYQLYYNVAPILVVAGREEELLGDEYEALVESLGAEFDSYVLSYAESSYPENPTDEDKEAAYEEALAVYEEAGITRESYIADSLATEAFMVILDNLEYEPTEEEIQAAFDEEIAYEKSYFEGNVTMYEYYQMYGYSFYYVPSGYRGITHILLEVDEELLDEYNNAEDDETAEAAKTAILESVQDEINDIYAQYEAGVPFEELIALYNTDPGMDDPDTLAAGYPVHKDSITYMQEFTDGAFAEEMAAPGDISSPVLTSYGVHILYYLRDIPEAELTDEVREELISSLRSENEYNIVVGWLKEYEVVYGDTYSELITEATFLD